MIKIRIQFIVYPALQNVNVVARLLNSSWKKDEQTITCGSK